MKPRRLCVLSCVSLAMAISAIAAADPATAAPDKTLSPYFEIEGGDATVESMPLEATRAEVYGMKMTIGARVIEAKIKEREAARQEYDEAKRAGKTASLLEQDRPNVFSMNVANILPRDHIEVELHYTELLVPTDGVYELVYPTVVGPRYASARVDASDAHNKFVATPY